MAEKSEKKSILDKLKTARNLIIEAAKEYKILFEKSKFKHIFVDVDGTICKGRPKTGVAHSDEKSTELNREDIPEGIDLLFMYLHSAAKVPLSYVSGRSLDAVKWSSNDMGISSQPLICQNGGLVQFKDKVKGGSLTLHIGSKGAAVAAYNYLKEIFDLNGRWEKSFDSERSTDVLVYKHYFNGMTQEEIQKIIDEGLGCGYIKVTDSGSSHYHLSTAGKGDGILSYLKVKNIGVDEVIFCGNAQNDEDAFKKLKYTVCPSNSMNQIKEIAMYVSEEPIALGSLEGILSLLTSE